MTRIHRLVAIALVALSGPAVLARQTPANSPADEIERLKEEIELLAAKHETSEAIVRSAEASLKVAEADSARLQKLGNQNLVSREELDRSAAAFESAKAQLQIRVAESRETGVRLDQAKRRLGRMPGAKPLVVKPADSLGDQLEAIKKQLTKIQTDQEVILKKLEALEDIAKQHKATQTTLGVILQDLDKIKKDLQDIAKKLK